MGSSRNGRDSNSQRLGVKAFGGQLISAGSIIVRQVGSQIHQGDNVDDVAVRAVTRDLRSGAESVQTTTGWHENQRRALNMNARLQWTERCGLPSINSASVHEQTDTEGARGA
mgnify:CR=1 FL=1